MLDAALAVGKAKIGVAMANISIKVISVDIVLFFNNFFLVSKILTPLEVCIKAFLASTI